MSNHAYLGLVSYLSGGGRLPPSEIRRILAAAGRTADSLIDSVLAGPSGGGPAPGDSCPACGSGSLVVVGSKRRGAVQVQYLGCPVCGRRPANGKRCVPAGLIRRRRKESA